LATYGTTQPFSDTTDNRGMFSDDPFLVLLWLTALAAQGARVFFQGPLWADLDLILSSYPTPFACG
jgi:hypothetical protein